MTQLHKNDLLALITIFSSLCVFMIYIAAKDSKETTLIITMISIGVNIFALTLCTITTFFL